MIARVLARVGMTLLGYCTAVIAATISFMLLLMLLSILFPDNQLMSFLGLGPLVAMVAPAVVLFLMLVVAVVTYIPALMAVLVSELFALRTIWLYLMISMLLAVAAAVQLDWYWFMGMTETRLLISLAAGGGAIVGGLVYWLVAGQNAGIRTRAPQ